MASIRKLAARTYLEDDVTDVEDGENDVVVKTLELQVLLHAGDSGITCQCDAVSQVNTTLDAKWSAYRCWRGR